MRHGRSPFAAIAISVLAALFISNLWLQSNVQEHLLWGLSIFQRLCWADCHDNCCHRRRFCHLVLRMAPKGDS